MKKQKVKYGFLLLISFLILIFALRGMADIKKSEKNIIVNKSKDGSSVFTEDYDIEDYRVSDGTYDIMLYLGKVLPDDSRVIATAASEKQIVLITVSEEEIDFKRKKTKYSIYEIQPDTGVVEKKCSYIKEYSVNRKINTSTLKINNAMPLIYYDDYDKAITVLSKDYKKVIETGVEKEEPFPRTCCFSENNNAIYYFTENTSNLMKMDYDVLMENADETGEEPLGNEITEAEELSSKVMECEYGLGYKNLRGIDDNRLYITSYDMKDNIFIRMIYNPDNNEYESITEKSDDSDNYINTCSVGNEYVVLTAVDDAAERITDIYLQKKDKYFETSTFAADEKNTEGKVIKLPEETENILSDRVAEIENTYGVNIIVGDDVENQVPGYSLSVIKDKNSIEYALNEVDKALAIYPERFIQEIKNHSFININICLAGSIKSKDSDGRLANGVTASNWGYECIAVDITGKDIANTLIHEMSHVIDEKLERCGVLNDLDDKWMACNPKDFEYYNSYVGYEKNYKNTSYDNDYWLNDDPETVYFFDDYSKTYVKEDRARLLEHFNDFKVIDDCYKSSHIRAKLEAYFECLKNTFSSFKDFDSTYWGKLSSSNI